MLRKRRKHEAEMREKKKINGVNRIAAGGEKPCTAHLSGRCREETAGWLRAVGDVASRFI